LAVMAIINLGHKVQLIYIDIRSFLAYYCSVEREIHGNPWHYNIKNFMQN
jgi:hypothetical protein